MINLNISSKQIFCIIKKKICHKSENNKVIRTNIIGNQRSQQN